MAVSRKFTRLTRFANDLTRHSTAVKFIREALSGEEEFIEKLNREQLLRSETSKDAPIINLQTGSPIHAKKRRPFTLKDTGAFHRSITAKIAPKSIIISSTDRKAESLQERFGKEILGLGEQARLEILSRLKTKLPQLIRRSL